MTLAAGTRVGVYEVIGLVGAGGMGEVYRALDTRLKRDVALKVLPASLAGEADRLLRFAREAEMLAALNHPNIAAIYGVEDAKSASPAEAGHHVRAGDGAGRRRDARGADRARADSPDRRAGDRAPDRRGAGSGP